MAAATRLKCPTCGAKNDADATRCGVCTRALDLDRSPTQAAYAEVLYANPVRDSERAKPWIGRTWIALLVVLLAAMVNYQWWGQGPDWAHRPELRIERGATWRTVSETAAFTIAFPAEARIDLIDTPFGTAERAVAGVDERWVTDRSATNGITQQKVASDDDVDSTVVAVAVGAPAELTEDAALSLVGATLPGVALSAPDVRPVVEPSYGTQLNIDAKFTGGLGSADRGRVRARVISYDDEVFVVATFTKGSIDAELQSRLVAGFRPNGVLEAPDPGD